MVVPTMPSQPSGSAPHCFRSLDGSRTAPKEELVLRDEVDVQGAMELIQLNMELEN